MDDIESLRSLAPLMRNDSGVSRVSAIVLAAGLSSRMGTAKALVRIGGKTMLERVLGTLRESLVSEIVVVLGHSAGTIQRSIDFGNARPVINDSYREGMAGSLNIGLSNVSDHADAALIVLADQPFLKPETINCLIDEYRSKRPEIVIPVYRGFRGNPVLLSRSVFPELASLTGDIGCRAIFGNHTRGILKVPVDDAGTLVDLDTKEDIHRIEQTGAQEISEAKLFESADLRDREMRRPQLVIVGRDPVATALAVLADLLEFRTVLVDPFASTSDAPQASILRVLDFARLPQSDENFVVVTSRGRFDEEAIEQALNIDALYIGLLANKRRAQRLRASLSEKGIEKEKLDKVQAPAGLEIGASTPAEIALSIMAEAVSIRRRAHAV